MVLLCLRSSSMKIGRCHSIQLNQRKSANCVWHRLFTTTRTDNNLFNVNNKIVLSQQHQQHRRHHHHYKQHQKDDKSVFVDKHNHNNHTAKTNTNANGMLSAPGGERMCTDSPIFTAGGWRSENNDHKKNGGYRQSRGTGGGRQFLAMLAGLGVAGLFGVSHAEAGSWGNSAEREQNTQVLVETTDPSDETDEASNYEDRLDALIKERKKRYDESRRPRFIFARIVMGGAGVFFAVLGVLSTVLNGTPFDGCLWITLSAACVSYAFRIRIIPMRLDYELVDKDIQRHLNSRR